MYELIEIDPETGEEMLDCTGTLARLSEKVAEMIEQADDDGYDFPSLRIQPAQ